MKRLAISFALLSAAACDDYRKPNQPPADLVDLNENVWSCMMDADQTYPERSEHCVLAAEALSEVRREECETNSSRDCLTWRLAYSNLLYGYQSAVAESLFERGKSAEVENLEKRTALQVYRDGIAMRSLFDKCLADEARELEKAGLIKVTTIDRPWLQEGQRCFRKGYPNFRTRKSAVS